MCLWTHVAIWKHLATSGPHPCRELLLLTMAATPSSVQLACVPTVPAHLPSLRLSGNSRYPQACAVSPHGLQ